MPCPWYKNGLCTSPILERPSSDITLPSRCAGGPETYVSCRFYKDIEESKVENRHVIRDYGKPILIIHGLSKSMKSDCPFFKLLAHESGAYLAVCEVLKRFLNVYEVSICANYWNDCPLKRLGMRLNQ